MCEVKAIVLKKQPCIHTTDRNLCRDEGIILTVKFRIFCLDVYLLLSLEAINSQAYLHYRAQGYYVNLAMQLFIRIYRCYSDKFPVSNRKYFYPLHKEVWFKT